IRLLALLSLPLAATFAQEPAPDHAPAPVRVRSVLLAPAEPAEPLQPAEPQAPDQRGQIGVYLGADGDAPGAGVRALVQGGGAEAAGLQPGDRILAVDDQRVTTSAQLIEIVRSKHAGDTVSLMVDRDGWRKRLEVVLRPAQPQDAGAPRWQVVEELEEVEGDADARRVEVDGTQKQVELDELRKLIELHTGAPPEVRVDRRIWINGREVTPEPRGDAGTGPQRPEARKRQEQDRRRELRMERAQRQRDRMRAEQEQRMERELRVDPRMDGARSELEDLRRELHELRREVEALRRELNQRGR
ncbi:MAG: PDZ domain-containing protein, partial [Planctomycetes bacterium]|nr:PDZ domain-containing protein [Planctomycetota bacterium]